MSQPTILVVEDEESFIDALQLGLTREGFDVQVATDGVTALERFAQVAPDIVLLDVMLPRLSGIDVCRRIRAISTVPIIMVTARVSEIDTVVGLEVGADDYVAKPYRIRELVARIRALLRRSAFEGAAVDGPARAGVAVGNTGHDGTGGPDRSVDSSIHVGGVSLDVSEHRVVVDGADVALPLKEFEVLHLLLANAGRVLTRETLIDRVWGPEYVGDTKTLDVHIKRLRSKVEVEPGSPRRIMTIRGVGYKFDRPPAAASH